MIKLKTLGFAFVFLAMGSSSALADLDCETQDAGNGTTIKHCRTSDGDEICYICTRTECKTC